MRAQDTKLKGKPPPFTPDNQSSRGGASQLMRLKCYTPGGALVNCPETQFG